MKKAHEHASVILVAYADAVMQKDINILTEGISDVFTDLIFNELHELKKMRNVQTDNGLIPIFKEQRQKYIAICKIVNEVRKDMLNPQDFDAAVKEVYPDVYHWYEEKVLNLN